MKSIFASKTMWFNVLTVFVYVVSNYADLLHIPAEYAAAFLAVGNLILRMFTSEPVTLGKGQKVGAILAVFALGFMLSGCGAGVQTSTSFSGTTALAQLPGVAKAIVDIIEAAPVDDNIKKQASNWRDFAVSSSTALADGLDSKDQISGAMSALCSIAKSIPVDADTSQQISGYVAWAEAIGKGVGLAYKIVQMFL